MSNENENLSSNFNINSIKLVFYVLTFIPLIYLSILASLVPLTPDVITKHPIENFSKLDELHFTSILYFVLMFTIIFDFFVAELLTKQADKIEISEQKFGIYLVSYAILESVALYGLLYGLLGLFASTPPFISWERVILYIGIGLAFMISFFVRHIIPWLEEIKNKQSLKQFY